MLHAGRLWEFLSLHKSALEDKIFAVLGKVEENIQSSNWKEWLSGAEDKRKAALFMHSFAHTITPRPIARCAKIPDTGITWGDAENDGFVSLTGLRHLQMHMQVNTSTGISWLSHSHLPAPFICSSAQRVAEALCYTWAPC